jgi:hypothetical protein
MSQEPTDGERGKRTKEQFQPPFFEAEPKHTDEGADTDAGEDEKENLSQMSSRFYDTFFRDKAAAWTAVFTCVLAVFSYLLWQANTQANETSIATQRAFITFSGPYLEKLVENNVLTGYRIHIPMLDGGTTAAKVEFEESAAVQDAIPGDQTNFDALTQSERSHYVFGPKQTYDPQGAVLTVSDFEAIEKGKHTFVWGWAVYRDTFPGTETHLSEYCLAFSNPKWSKPNHSDPTVDILVTNLPCQAHYCYEHDCKDYDERVQGFK